MEKIDLPQGWCVTELSKIGEVVTGKTPSKKDSSNFGQDFPFIKPGDIQNQGYIENTDEGLSAQGAKQVSIIPKNSIVITCIGNLGRTAITSVDSATNQQINSIVPYHIANHKYVYFYSLTLKSWMEDNASATTVTILNKSRFSTAPFLLPPLAEQKEIVRIIESHLQLVDQIKSRLDALPKILEQFRQSVLASAVSGKLTEEWRNSICEQVDVSFEIQLIKEDREKVFAVDAQIHKEKTGKNLRKYDYSTNREPIPDREIPNTWVIAPLGELINFLTDYHANGSYEVLRDHVQLQSEESYACMIRSTNFEQNDFNDLIYISESAYHFLGKSKLYGNEILVSKIGNAGRVYLMPNLNKPVSLGMNLFALRFTEKLIKPQYIYLFLISGLGTKNINKYVKGVATKSIDKKGLRSVFINLPPLEEQTEIVKRVDHLFALADQIEASIKHAQERVNLLTQSILAKAFRGEFTAKWREDNPDLISGENSAEALLKRIEEAKKGAKKKR